MPLAYRKTKAAERRFSNYAGNVPASWEVVVDGAVRGTIRGVCGQYSRDRRFLAQLDGVSLRLGGFGTLDEAKKAVEAAAAVGQARQPATA